MKNNNQKDNPINTGELLADAVIKGVREFLKDRDLALLAVVFSALSVAILLTVMDILSYDYPEIKFLQEIFLSAPLISFPFLFSIPLSLRILYLGVKPTYYETVEDKFKRSGITDPDGSPPKVRRIERISEGTFKASLDITGIDKDSFKKNKNLIESIFDKYLTEIKDGSRPSFVDLYFTIKTLPTLYSFKQAVQKITSPFECVIGRTLNQEILSSISSWPHGLIAGSTGGGKSNQMKSIIAQFIYSTNIRDSKGQGQRSAQVILCDLKRGVEFSQFEGIPSVKVYSELDEILGILKTLVLEMNNRYELARRNHRDQTDLELDQKDFILLAIDEASLLFSPVRRGDPEYDKRHEARMLIRDLLKLGRAAKISVIFGLQRPSKESIDVEVQENIDARICFKINTLEGSIRMLGNKDALELSAIPGRSIWKMGNDQCEIQTPLITKADIERLKRRERALFTSGKKRLNQEKLQPHQATLEVLTDFEAQERNTKGANS